MSFEATTWMAVPKRVGVYQRGDRVAWCEGCYGEVVAVIGGTVIIRTDDDVDRMTSETNCLDVERRLQASGIKWK